MEERLQKILARAGYGSRRSCEELIVAGRIKVNGNDVELGSKADMQKDVISVDGQPLPKKIEPVYIALHKPRGVLSDQDMNDPRKTVFDLVQVQGHLFAVGRLDYDSEGLILLTNDGELANRLTHPRYGHEKEYRVLVVTKPDERQLAAWRHGVVLEDGYRTAPARVNIESSAGKAVWLRIVLREGRKRQIREVGSRIGLPVQRIVRQRIGTLLLGELRPGEWRLLTETEIKNLQASASESPEGAPRRYNKAPLRRRTGSYGPGGVRRYGGRGTTGEFTPRSTERPAGNRRPSSRDGRRADDQAGEDRPFRNEFRTADDRRPGEDRPFRSEHRPLSDRQPGEDRPVRRERRSTDDRHVGEDRPFRNERSRTGDRQPGEDRPVRRERRSADDRRPGEDRPFRSERRPTEDRRPGEDRPFRSERRPAEDRRPGEDRPIRSDRRPAEDRRPGEDRPIRSDRRPAEDRRPGEDRPRRRTGERVPGESRPIRSDRRPSTERRPGEDRPDERKSGQDRPFHGEHNRTNKRPPFGERAHSSEDRSRAPRGGRKPPRGGGRNSQ